MLVRWCGRYSGGNNGEYDHDSGVRYYMFTR
jgi:hypothetical protein